MPEEKWEEAQVLNYCTLSENIAGEADLFKVVNLLDSLFRLP